MSRTPSPLTRKELALCLGLLLIFVGLRIVGASALAFDLLDPEELLNLRLARQLEAGLPLGELGHYWYTGVGGNLGAGSLVLSLLYVPLGWFVELDVGAVRSLASLWAIGAALLMAGIGRCLLGTGGAAAGLGAAVAMPPTWLAWSLSAPGNYFEASVLSLLAAWLLLRCAAAQPGSSRLAWAGGLGLTLSGSAWFCVSAMPPAALLAGLATGALLSQDRRAATALAAGLLLGALPWMLGLEPSEDPGSPVSRAELMGALGSTLGSPSDWPAIVAGSYATLPVLAYRDAAPEDWAAGWQLASRSLVVGGSFAAVLACGVGVLGPSSWRQKLPLPEPAPGGRMIVLVGVALALSLPLGMSCLGVGHETLPGKHLYFWDARRVALVYPIAGLAWGAGAWLLWQLEGRARLPSRAVVVILLLATVASQASLVRSAEGPQGSFHPVRYLLCPSEQPAQESAVCITALWEDQVAVLEALVELEPLSSDVEIRRATLQGFGTLERDEDLCELPPGGLRPGPHTGWTAFGFGAAAGSGCLDQVQDLCSQSPDGSDGRCHDGARWVEELLATPGQ